MRELLRWAVGRPSLIVATAALIVAVLSCWQASWELSFCPNWMRESSGSEPICHQVFRLAKSAEMAKDMRAILKESAEVKLVSSQTGRNDSGTDPVRAKPERVTDHTDSLFNLETRKEKG